jgi:hypothetical protein
MAPMPNVAPLFPKSSRDRVGRGDPGTIEADLSMPQARFAARQPFVLFSCVFIAFSCESVTFSNALSVFSRESKASVITSSLKKPRLIPIHEL